jgi:hypothetical protein
MTPEELNNGLESAVTYVSGSSARHSCDTPRRRKSTEKSVRRQTDSQPMVLSGSHIANEILRTIGTLTLQFLVRTRIFSCTSHKGVYRYVCGETS